MKAINKPFVIILNSSRPYAEDIVKMAKNMEEKHKAKVIPLNCMMMTKRDIDEIIKSILYEFPLCETEFYMPEWINALESDNTLKNNMNKAVFESFEDVLNKISKKVK